MASRISDSGIREAVYGILRDNMPDYARPIAPKYELGKDLGFDSLEFYELIGKVEERFDIHAENKDLLFIRTVDDLVRYVEDQKANNKT